MMANRTKTRRKLRKFDAKMIRDFLELLHLEIRMRVHENENPGVKTPPEIVEDLARYYRRYNCVGFTPPTMMVDDTGDREKEKLATAIVRQVQIQRGQEAIAALEALEPYFTDAFLAIPEKEIKVRPFNVSEVLERSGADKEFDEGAEGGGGCGEDDLEDGDGEDGGPGDGPAVTRFG